MSFFRNSAAAQSNVFIVYKITNANNSVVVAQQALAPSSAVCSYCVFCRAFDEKIIIIIVIIVIIIVVVVVVVETTISA